MKKIALFLLQIQMLAFLYIGIAGCVDEKNPSGKQNSSKDSAISDIIYEACINYHSTCDNQKAICSMIQNYAKEKDFDKIGTYRNEAKNETLTVRCMQYANIYNESLELFRETKDFKIINTEECQRLSQYVGKLLFKKCSEANRK